MSKKILIPFVLVLTLVIVYFVFGTDKVGEERNIIAPVEQGDFMVDINVTGELQAKNSVKILGPPTMRRFRINETTVQHLIDEGTVVRKGQYVGRLDVSPVMSKIQDAQIELQQDQSKFTQTQLDTTLQMKEARNNLINLGYTMEQKKNEYDQSEFEPPAVQNQKRIEFEKAQRALDQAKENLLIKKKQNIAKMRDVGAAVRKQEIELEGLQKLASEFTIIAPEDGMLIYHKNWNGAVKTGSQIRSWDPTIATLPDLTSMLSITYVNEVDIRNIKKGQIVEIGLDAFPKKRLSGTVTSVANVGEQRKNSDAKVFLVNIELADVDDLLRPAMTTSNKIITEEFKDVMYVPLEALHSQGDSISYVFKSDGFNVSKQQVIVGKANTTHVIIEEGLQASDKVYLSSVKGAEQDDISMISTSISQK
ncbi:MAG: efflux RND transporter periplasmic adaptor subunit [Bacteroidota bacterium]